ncbi:unnamed protein product [Cladocopium goreaui]|uniref:Pentatricopeptide repeat-containing protein GUN1, chloroplastic (Pentatricopeptide repeat-containing protein At2g31400) (Protein GENOMES UNCOUPLED 1) n=1 Tax=Cladocopium goreaui TaxID=2562237 RepID=A0A9P1BP05_9DINO|nr:unnamed protein product [Cladocopium goreaui]
MANKYKELQYQCPVPTSSLIKRQVGTPAGQGNAEAVQRLRIKADDTLPRFSDAKQTLFKAGATQPSFACDGTDDSLAEEPPKIGFRLGSLAIEKRIMAATSPHMAPAPAQPAQSAWSVTKQINAHAKAAQWREALGLLHVASEERLEADRVMLGATISACHRASQWRPGLSLLLDAAKQRLADDIAFNMVIASCEHAGLWEQTLELLRQTGRLQGRSSHGVRGAIAACRRAEQWQWVLQLWADNGEGREDAEMRNSVLRAYQRASWWQDATQLLSSLQQPNSKDIAIGLQAASGQAPQVLALLQRMREGQLQADLRIYTTAMAGCVEGRDWQSALCLFEDAETNLRPDQQLLEVSLGACAVGGQWQLAIELLQRCRWGPDRPGIFYYNKALASCHSGAWTVAVELLSQAFERSVQSNVVSYREVMNSCASARAWMMAIELLRLAPRDVELRRLAQRAVGGARPRAALQLLRQLRCGRCTDTRAFNDAMVACKASWRVVLEVMDEMQLAELHPDEVTYLALVQALKGSKKWMLPQIFQKAKAQGVQMLPRAYKLSIRACAEAAQWQQAMSFLEEAEGHFGSMDAGTLTSISKYSWRHTLHLISLLRKRKTTPEKWLQHQAVQTLQEASRPREALQLRAIWATWEGALQLFSNWREAIEFLSLEPCEKMARVALHWCASSYAWPHALALLPDVNAVEADNAYALALEACEEALEWEQALALMSYQKRHRRRDCPMLRRDELMELIG